MPVDRRLLPGIFIGSHAIAEGLLTRNQLRRRSYVRLVQGVYADPGLPYDHQLRARGVALLLPPGTAIGGLSAAAWYGAPVAGPRDPVTVLRPAAVLWKGPRGVRVHRSDLRPGDIEDVDGVPVTGVVRTAWDVAALEPLGTAVAALDAMVRGEALDLSALAAAADAGTRRWGVQRVRRAIPLVDPSADSPPESRIRVALTLAGLAPETQFRAWDGDRWLGQLDFAWPEAKVALEYEGAYHFDAEQIDRDDDRYAALVAAGWVVIRVALNELHDLDAVVRQVQQALDAR
ncbi:MULTISPECIES: DUF559 domain-containing protein [unclassified Modestobacter]